MRIRTVKPELFTHTKLADLEHSTGLPVRLSFIGLLCAADREGRFKWDARRLGIQILPYDQINFGAILDALVDWEFVVKYDVDGKEYGCIPSFPRHQVINTREQESSLPPFDSQPDLFPTTNAVKAESKKEKEIAMPFESVEFSNAWERWNDHRTEKKKKLTPSTSSMQLKKLESVGEARAIKMIDYSIENGWLGLFEDQAATPIPLQRKPQTSDQFSL
jgi:hypothetical protein